MLIAVGELIGEKLVGACSEARVVSEKPAAFLAARAQSKIGADTVALYRRRGASQRP